MQNFTDNYLKTKLKPTGKPYRRMDIGRAGFGVQVSAKGTITFIHRYTSPISGKDIPLKIGIYKKAGKKSIFMTLEKARQKWEESKTLLDAGKDPKYEFEQREREEIGRIKAEQERIRLENSKGTIEKLFQVYHADLKEQDKKSANEVLRALELDTYKHIPKDTKARDVTIEQLKAVIAEPLVVREKLTQANRLRSYLAI